jgi:hypothetical protein
VEEEKESGEEVEEEGSGEEVEVVYGEIQKPLWAA